MAPKSLLPLADYVRGSAAGNPLFSASDVFWVAFSEVFFLFLDAFLWEMEHAAFSIPSSHSPVPRL